MQAAAAADPRPYNACIRHGDRCACHAVDRACRSVQTHVHAYACPHLKNRSSCSCYHSRQAKAHVTCWRGHVKPDRSIEYGRSRQHAPSSPWPTARAPVRRGRPACTRARGSLLFRRSGCPVNPRHGMGATGAEGTGRDAGGAGVIMVFPRRRSGAMAPATWRTLACWTGV